MKRAEIGIVEEEEAETWNADDPVRVTAIGNVDAVVLGQGLKNEPRKGPGLVKEKGGPGHVKVVKRGPGLETVKGPDVQGLGSLNRKKARMDGVGLRLRTSLMMVWVMKVTRRMTTKGTILNRNVQMTRIENRSTLTEAMTIMSIR